MISNAVFLNNVFQTRTV